MQLDQAQLQLLLNVVQTQGLDVIHLPYTSSFETLCKQVLGHAPSIEEKHELWERTLEIRSSSGALPSSDLPESPPQQAAPGATPPVAVAPTLPQTQDPSQPFPNSLFPDRSVLAQQPWTLPNQPPLVPELQRERDRLLADIANSQLGTMEQRVAYLLHRFPETRESDIALCIQYWRRFQADVLETWNPLELEVLFELDRLETIGRIRRHIQELRLFRRTEETIQYAEFFQKQLHEYLAAHRGVIPEVRFYLDETGNEGDKTFIGVAGVCVMNWKQYEKHHAALEKWRRDQNWPEAIHFSETGSERIDRAIGLLAELTQRRSGLLFVGYALQSRGRTHEDLLSLFIQLVIDCLHYLRRSGCLGEPRSLRLLKEADPGFDNIYLAKMNKQLSDLVGLEFPGQIVVQPIESVAKGREVFLECADLVAGGMQRRALYKGRNPKDKLAESVVNVTGFEDPSDDGAIFKLYPFR